LAPQEFGFAGYGKNPGGGVRERVLPEETGNYYYSSVFSLRLG
jgi:hypothetical protein